MWMYFLLHYYWMDQSFNCLRCQSNDCIAGVDSLKDDSRELCLWQHRVGSSNVAVKILQHISFFSASSFFHLSYAVSRSLLWHPILSLGVLQLPLHMTSSGTITVPLIWLKTHPGLLASKNLQLHNTDSWFSSFCRVTVLRCRLEVRSLHWTQNPLRIYKSTLF